MARTPIQITPPTFEPGFSARAFAAGGEAGSQAGRNVVSAMDTASRERVAQLNATLRSRELDSQERMFLEEQKNDTNQFLQELDLRREQQAQEIENRVQLQNSEQQFRAKMADATGDTAVGKLRGEQLKAVQEYNEVFGEGASMNDPRVQQAANRVAVSFGQVNDVLERAQWQTPGANDPSNFNWHRAQAQGNETAANQSFREFHNAVSTINALESRLGVLQNLDTPQSTQDWEKTLGDLAEATAFRNTYYQRAGKPTEPFNPSQWEHIRDRRTREEEAEAAASRRVGGQTRLGAYLRGTLEKQESLTAELQRVGGFHGSMGVRPVAASIATNVVRSSAERSPPITRAITRTGTPPPAAALPVAPQPTNAPPVDFPAFRRNAAAQQFSDELDNLRRIGLRHAEQDFR